MEVETLPDPVVTTPPLPPADHDDEDISGLEELLTAAEESTDASTALAQYNKILEEKELFGLGAMRVKEVACYGASRKMCEMKSYEAILPFLTESCKTFFDAVPKSKVAKIVRAVIEILSKLANEEYELLQNVCESIIAWCKREKRTFLKQRIESKLCSVLFNAGKFNDSLTLVNSLLLELKRLDDKQLLVETHLTESKIHHGLRNIPKAKAALTASRTAANAIYVVPALQAEIDMMSGILHTEEGDYNTAHSYFLEAFEQLDTLDDTEKAIPCLKYMMLCKILDMLNASLKLSASNVVGAKSSKAAVSLSAIISGKQGVKYAGRNIEAMGAIADAASKRSLREFETVSNEYKDELQSDLLVQHHLHVLYEQLLESNLIRIIEPFSCVEIAHVAKLIDMPVNVVELKLSKMILDGQLNGILDQGNGQLILYEDKPADTVIDKGITLVSNMNNVVDSLFTRSKNMVISG